MSDYTKTTNFTAKDALDSGDPLKLIKGSYFDTEFDNIATAIATKYDSNDIASQAQAEALTSNTVILTPGRLNDVLVANGGMLANIQALADPGFDTMLGWDESANDVISFAFVAPIATSTTNLTFNISGLTAFAKGGDIAGADLFYIDDGAGGTHKVISYQNLGIPVENDTASKTFALTDANRLHVGNHASTPIVYTIDAEGTVNYPIGTVFSVMQLGAAAVSIALTTDTLRAPHGSICSAQYAVISATKIASATWVITGDATS